MLEVAGGLALILGAACCRIAGTLLALDSARAIAFVAQWQAGAGR
ncbi:hypothetical protein GCM10020220_028470 [Nonomuraea rubra]